MCFLNVYQFVPCASEGGVWDLSIHVPDHCLSFNVMENAYFVIN